MSTVIQRQLFRKLLSSRLGIDGRALGAFRIGLALILVGDLLLRARNLALFYSDDGVLPIERVAEEYPTAVRFSLHTLSGSLWYQAALFGLAIGCGVLLLVGYRTRIATALSFGLLVSLHARNPYLLSAGDALLQHLLFWSLFLPLGSRWSVDARRTDADCEQITSVATAALLIQVLLVYGVNAVLKLRSDQWLRGTAIEAVFGIEQYTVLLGPMVAEISPLMRVANWTWVVLLVCSPLLILASGWPRAVLAGLFASAHFGMLLTMQLGIFPLVSMLALVVFLPGVVWDLLERLTDDSPPRRGARGAVGQLDGVLPDVTLLGSGQTLGQWPARVGGVIVVVVLTALVVLNAMAVGLVPVVGPVDRTVEGEPSDSRWTLFAPNPPTNDRWYAVSGQRESGETGDVLGPAGLSWPGPDTDVSSYSTARMRKYASNLGRDESIRRGFSAYLCEEWTANHDGHLESVSVAYVRATPDGESDTTRTELVVHTCDRSAG